MLYGYGLIKGQIDLVRLVDLLVGLIDRQAHFLDYQLVLGVDLFDSFGIGAEFGHRALAGTKVVDHSLVNQDVAVSQKEDALGFGACRIIAPKRLRQAMNNLEGSDLLSV